MEKEKVSVAEKEDVLAHISLRENYLRNQFCYY
jgi:hypothetical protein